MHTYFYSATGRNTRASKTSKMQQVTRSYTYGDSDVVSIPAGFRRHLVGPTVRNVFHCDIAEVRFVGKLVTIQTFS